MKKCLLLLMVLMNVGVACSQTRNKKSVPLTQMVHLIFRNMAGDSVLQKGSIYNNAFGEPFRVSAFKYYITNIRLQYADKHTFKINAAPHLVNETDIASKQLFFIAPAGNITGIQFLLGVDSVANTTGVHTGDLDPAKGMYWIWNTGYIMAKLEGNSAAAKTPGHQFSYDIGGYKSGEQAARKIILVVPSTVNHQQSTITLEADALKWFSGAQDITISGQPMCHEPGKLAMQVADNYEKMFRVKVE